MLLACLSLADSNVSIHTSVPLLHCVTVAQFAGVVYQFPSFTESALEGSHYHSGTWQPAMIGVLVYPACSDMARRLLYQHGSLLPALSFACSATVAAWWHSFKMLGM